MQHSNASDLTMFAENSPFLNIPAALDRKQAVFLDGIRHATQIVDLSYKRLCQTLTALTVDRSNSIKSPNFTHAFLDAWAFVDSADRFRSLWEMQPGIQTITESYSPAIVRAQLQSIREVRNVSAHIAQQIEQIVSLNRSVLGSISWIALLSEDPLEIRTFSIRPGVMFGNVDFQFTIPKGALSIGSGVGYISLAAGKHEANLSEAYKVVLSVVRFAEATLRAHFNKPRFQNRLPTDMFASGELEAFRVQRPLELP